MSDLPPKHIDSHGGPDGTAEAAAASHAQSAKSTFGLRRILDATRYSAKGLRAAWRHESAFRQDCIVVAIGLAALPWVARTWLQAAALACALLGILLAELVNSAIEALCDAVTQDYHPLIGRAKDIGSAVVMVSFAMAAIVWLGVIAANY